MPNKIKYPVEELIGKKFTKLYVTGPEERIVKNGKTVRYIYAKCDCGKDILVRISGLVSGSVTSCGCRQTEAKENLGKARHSGKIKSPGNTSHNDSVSTSEYYKLYKTWRNMRSRCMYECCTNYKWYGGRGIKVCDEWNKDYLTFKKWALENNWAPGLEIDRIDSDKNYEPDNCRWTTRKEQNNNSSHNVRVELYGLNKTISEWSEIIGMRDNTIRAKIYRGATPEDAVNSYINPNPEIKKPFIIVKNN